MRKGARIPGVYTAGKDCSIKIGTVIYPFAYWSAEFPTDALLTTAFGNQFKHRIAGLKDVRVTLRGRYFMGGMPLVQGDLVTVSLMVGATVLATGPVIIENIKPTADSDDTQNAQMIEVTCVCANDWTVTIV